MKYLITGGAGFIGSAIVQKLIRKKHSVVVLDNLSTGKKENLASVADKIQFIKGDITDKKMVEKAVKGADFISHQAASLSVVESVEYPQKYIKNNIIGTQNLLESAKKHKTKKFIFASSCSVYGTARTIPTSENYEGIRLSPYAITKKTGEDLCLYYDKVHHLPVVILRYFNVFGPRQLPGAAYAGVISVFIKNILSGKPMEIFGAGEQTRNYIFVDDIAEINYQASQSGLRGKIINVGTGREISVNEIAQTLSKIFDYKKVKHLSVRSGEAARASADIKLFKKTFPKVKLTGFAKGLEKTIVWWKAKNQV